MKNLISLLFIVPLIFLSSCDSQNEDINDEYADYLVARPLVMSKNEFRNSVEVLPARGIIESGKIYAYGELIFVNDKYKGVHVIDNSDPSNPQKVRFINIPGNVDISVKGNYLYADSLSDLVVLDISDINNVRPVARLENVFQEYLFWPVEAEIFEWPSMDHNTEIQVGWEVKTERRKVSEVNLGSPDILTAEAGNDTSGQGGSLARFKIVDTFLYAVDSHNINVFDIADFENPVELEDVFAGFDIETIFNLDQYLFLGSMRGMYIYDISTPSSPSFVSEFQHGTACDPVVVDGQYAYITLRGGNGCGATESGLFIVDISTITEPSLMVSYPMDEPFGLGIKDEKLFVCDGSFGLKVYDKTNVEDLVLLNHFENIVTYDVIPLQNVLLMVGEGVLYQYEYLDADIRLLSSLTL